MSADSAIKTVVGNGVGGRAEEGAAGTNAAIAEPFGVVVGPDGSVVFCDLGNHRICRIDPESRRLSVIAGTGAAGHGGDGGPAREASMQQPYEVRFDNGGDLIFVDMVGQVIRQIDARRGVIDAIAGTGEAGFGGDGGPAREALFRQPHSIEIGPDGAIYVADIGNHRLRRIDVDTGIIETFAGTGEPAPTVDGADVLATPLNGPRTLAFDAAGDLFLTLREGNAVYRIDMRNRTIHHIAGTGRPGYAGDGGDAKAADLAGPKGISVDASGVYIADTESHTIRRIDRQSGVITTVVGNGKQFDGGDGDPLNCGLARPHGVFVAPDGRLFIGDTDNHRVRVLQSRSLGQR